MLCNTNMRSVWSSVWFFFICSFSHLCSPLESSRKVFNHRWTKCVFAVLRENETCDLKGAQLVLLCTVPSQSECRGMCQKGRKPKLNQIYKKNKTFYQIAWGVNTDTGAVDLQTGNQLTFHITFRSYLSHCGWATWTELSAFTLHNST